MLILYNVKCQEAQRTDISRFTRVAWLAMFAFAFPSIKFKSKRILASFNSLLMINHRKHFVFPRNSKEFNEIESQLNIQAMKDDKEIKIYEPIIMKRRICRVVNAMVCPTLHCFYGLLKGFDC